MDTIKLYRADKRGNKTLPERFATDGLLTKQIGSGDHPIPHEKYGWLNTIKAHIKYSNKAEKFIYDRTQYLSFTTDLEIANKYLSTHENLMYQSSTKDTAEAYLFSATIKTAQIKQIEIGMYLYEFKCNYDKVKTDSNFYTPILSDFIKCNICTNIANYHHSLILIDAKTYLSPHKDKFKEEYESAVCDKEWLILPADRMIEPHAIGFQARIPIANFWEVDFYKYVK